MVSDPQPISRELTYQLIAGTATNGPKMLSSWKDRPTPGKLSGFAKRLSCSFPQEGTSPVFGTTYPPLTGLG